MPRKSPEPPPITSPLDHDSFAIDIGEAECVVAHLPPFHGDTTTVKLPRNRIAGHILDAVDGKPVLVTMEMTGGLEQPILLELEKHANVELQIAQNTDSAALRRLLRRPRKTDRLDADLIARLAVISKDPHMAAVVADFLTPWKQMRTAVIVRPAVRHYQSVVTSLTRAQLQLGRRKGQAFAAGQLEEQIVFFKAQKEKAEAELIAAAGPNEKLLTTIPGISPRRACLITAAIGDISRFSTPHKLVRYLSLTPPHTPTSAGKPVGKPKRERGSDLLAGELHLWAFGIAARPASYGSFGEAVLRYKERGETKIGMWTARRQLIRCIWAMLTDGTDYGAPSHARRKRKEAAEPLAIAAASTSIEAEEAE